jgi:hypothetical protein
MTAKPELDVESNVTHLENTRSGRPSVPSVPEAKGELVVMPQPALTLEQLTDRIRKGHGEVVGAVLHAVMSAIETGKALRVAKKEVGHGNFEDYVTIECHFALRTAQNYMRLAKHEHEVRQLLSSKNASRAYLTMSEALKYLDKLGKKNPRKKRTKSAT